MARTGENIYKRKDGRWEARYIKEYSSDGKAKYGYLYADTYTAAREKLRLTLSTRPKKSALPLCLFADVAEKWLDSVKVNCKISTYNKYRNAYEKHLRETLGKYPLDKIGAESIDAFKEKLLSEDETGKALAHKTAQDVLTVVKQIYSFAEDTYGILPLFPLKKLHVKQIRSEMETLPTEEVKVLCSYLAKERDPYNAGILLALFTGVRIGELCALRWEDFSFADNTVHISGTVQRIQQLENETEKTKVVLLPPKTETSGRVIPVPNFLAKILVSLQKEGDVFFLSGEKTPAEPRTVQNKFRRAVAACNVSPVTFHALRHTFATQCVEHGVDAKTLSEILGHSSVNITLNRYVHSSLQMKKEAVNRLDFQTDSPSKK